MSKVTYIKENFSKLYKGIDSPTGSIRSKIEKFNGVPIRTRDTIRILVEEFKPKSFLEIGSWHYDTSNFVAELMMTYKTDFVIDSFDIKQGGYDGMINYKPAYKNINARYWLPHKTKYDDFKYTDQGIVHKEFMNMTNEEIFETNLKYLKEIMPQDGYDMIYIDGDHSFEGASFDWEYSKIVASKDSIIIIDDINDDRLLEVRRFFDSITCNKYDFMDWNDVNPDKYQNVGIAEIC